MNMPLHFRRAGQGETLVLVHGYLGGSAQWANEIRHLSSDFDVIALDLPGFGDSRGLEAPQTIEGFACAVLNLLDWLGVSTFRLLGHSMGGMIVQDMARLAPHRISQLFLYGTGPLGSLPGRFETIEETRARLRIEGVASTATRISARWFKDGAQSPAHAFCAQIACQANENAALAGLNAMHAWDGRDELSKLHIPTQIIWGEYDRSYNFEQVQVLWRGIAHCSLAVIPHAGHAAHLEQPALFASLLTACLQSLSVSLKSGQI